LPRRKFSEDFSDMSKMSEHRFAGRGGRRRGVTGEVGLAAKIGTEAEDEVSALREVIDPVIDGKIATAVAGFGSGSTTGNVMWSAGSSPPT
jgi:hypothetical protein